MSVDAPVKSQRSQDLAEMAKFRREWRVQFGRMDLATLIATHDWFYALVEKYPYHLDEDAEILEEFHAKIESKETALIADAQKECPIAFFKPSWEQAQILNAWSPEFEPELAPNGYRSVLDFCANRIGKTCVMVIDTLLWILPNDPNWLMFEEMEDTSPQKRGKYRVFRRPNWDYWHRTGRMIYDPTQPPKSECEIWQGVVDDDHWNTKIGKEYRRWMPPSAIGTRGKDLLWMIAEKWFQTKWGSTVKAKSYNSDVLAWAGKAVWRVNLDEGLSRNVYTEALTRVQAGGYFHWAYTPAEARNLGDRTQLAYDASKLKDDVKPPGATKVFLNFAMVDAPEWILPAEKKADDMRRYAAMGGQGKVRMEGGFFESSPVVFKNFKRAHHVLPWTGSEILKLYPDMCIIRGMDEGTAHPTTCVWTGILRTGEMIAFREFSESDLSVGQRCEKIIDLSGNTRIITHPHHDSSLRRYKENMIGMKVRRTFADSKIFKRDPENPADDWTDTYRKNGLLLERATNIGPAARCDYVNDLFLPDHTRKHLCSGTEHSHLYPTHGFRLYIAQDCEMLIERLENYLQEQVKSGVNVGKFTGQPGKDDDDLVDAACVKQGVLITTIDGDLEIEKVKAGDMVLTRDGYKPVTAAWQSSPSAKIWKLETESGKILEATNDHLVYKNGFGYVRLDSLCYGDSITICVNPKQSYSTESSSEGIPNQNAQPISVITPLRQITEGAELEHCTKRFGNQCMGIFQKACTFITKMVIHLITQLRTWLRLRLKSIGGFIQSKINRNNMSIWLGLGRSQNLGIDQKKGGLGIEITPRTESVFSHWLQRIARSVVMFFPPMKSQVGRLSFALGRAALSTEGDQVSIMYQGNAAFAGTCSPSVGLQKPSVVADRVLRVYETETKSPVYDLEVKDAHEFFAGGVLVHNCYALCSKVRWVDMAVIGNRGGGMAGMKEWEPDK